MRSRITISVLVQLGKHFRATFTVKVLSIIYGFTAYEYCHGLTVVITILGLTKGHRCKFSFRL